MVAHVLLLILYCFSATIRKVSVIADNGAGTSACGGVLPVDGRCHSCVFLELDDEVVYRNVSYGLSHGLNGVCLVFFFGKSSAGFPCAIFVEHRLEAVV